MQSIIQFLKGIGVGKIVGFVVVILALLLALVVYLLNNNDYAVLYSSLEPQESIKIIQELDNNNISYDISQDNTVIRVNKNNVMKARVILAQAGIPSIGNVIGYEIFDHEDSLSATSFSQNIKLVRALEGELSRTISAFNKVEKTRVHLVIPQREIFSKEKTETRASIVLKLKGNSRLGKSEIEAISNLVITSVPNLEMSNITIVDTTGKALKVGKLSTEEEFNSKNTEMNIEAENRLKMIIEDLLSRAFGMGKIKAHVSLQMNFDRVITNSELYDPDSSVVRSISSIEEVAQTPFSGSENMDSSVANNIPGAGSSSYNTEQEGRFIVTEKTEQQTNYEISKTIKNHISENGNITKMSIGILVDGTYVKNKDTGEMQYQERSEEELQKIKNLVKMVVGFDQKRNDQIEVVNMQFATDFSFIEDFDDKYLPNQDWKKIIEILIIAVISLVILITVVRLIVIKLFQSSKIRAYVKNNLSRPKNSSSDIDVDSKKNDTILSRASNRNIPKDNNLGLEQLYQKEGKVNLNVVGEDDADKAREAITKINDLTEKQLQDMVGVLKKWLYYK